MSRSFRIKLLVIFLFVIRLVMTEALDAQELGYGGVGSINHSMAGTAAALPLDGNGAIYWNPATMGDLEHGEFQLAFGRINAPWYGDETLGYSILIPAAVIVGGLWILGQAANDDSLFDWVDRDKSNNYSDPEPEADPVVVDDIDQFYRMRHPTVRGLSFSWILPGDKDIPWNFGISVRQLGSRKMRFFGDPEDENIKYGYLYRVKTIEIAPAFSIRAGKRFQFGISPIMSFDEFPDGSIPTFHGYTRKAERKHFGLGLQLGMYYRMKNGFSVGGSILSPYWMPKRNVQWIDGDSNIMERNLHFSPDHPLRIVFGIAYTKYDNLKLALDVRHYNFQHLSSLHRVPGHSSVKSANSIAAGIEYAIDSEFNPIVLRFGYQFNDCSAGWDDLWYNISPPVSGGHSIHYGLSLGIPRNKGLEFSLSISHTLGDKYYDFTTDSGPSRVRRNPNHNAFWWSLRYKY